MVDEEGRRICGGNEYILSDRMGSFFLSIYTGTEGLYRQYMRASNLLLSRRTFQTFADTGELRSPFR